MHLHNISHRILLTAGLYTGAILLAPSAAAEALPEPAAVVALPQTNLSVEKASKQISHSDAVWQRRWMISLAPLVASQVMDAASSYGRLEMNPLLADPNGAFGNKALGVKFGTLAGVIGVEYFVVKKYPRSAKFLSLLNFTSAGVTTALAVHNYRVP